jgi:uncharacterized protein
MSRPQGAQARLSAALARRGPLAVAVSGGVDSMLLMHAAHVQLSGAVAMHAVSPAVPEAATERVKRHAARHGWSLRLLDAGELADPRYTANPANRCFFCKENLYARIRAGTDLPIASGANADDLGDYRPGLDAARHAGVVHPFVEAGIGKADIYAMAAARGLDDIAALPAQPCLASRIETGIAVDAAALAFIERAEMALAALIPDAEALRCRVTAAGIVAELSPMPAAAVVEAAAARLTALAASEGRAFAGVRPYRRGSAFLRERR